MASLSRRELEQVPWASESRGKATLPLLVNTDIITARGNEECLVTAGNGIDKVGAFYNTNGTLDSTNPPR